MKLSFVPKSGLEFQTRAEFQGKPEFQGKIEFEGQTEFQGQTAIFGDKQNNVSYVSKLKKAYIEIWGEQGINMNWEWG